MSEETKPGTQTFDSSSETVELRSSQETEMEPAISETHDSELTLRSVDEGIKQATDPILKRVEELRALLASRTEMESAGNSDTSGSRRDRELFSPPRNRYHTTYAIFVPEGNLGSIKKRIFMETSILVKSLASNAHNLSNRRNWNVQPTHCE